MAKITNQGLNSALHQLWVFSLSGDFWQVLDTAFGTEYNRENAQILRLQWQKGDFSQLPQMEIVDGGILGDGNGAYSSSENRIYLSSKLIEKGTLGLVSKVLIEEIGHYVDAYINTVDSPGDEGAIFAALVLGEGLNKDEISQLKAEEDLASVTIGDKTVEVEKNVAPTLAIASTNATQLEGNTGIKAFTFTVTRSGDTTSDSSANWAVTGFGTNQADVMDFGGTAGIVSFAAGEITKTIIVDVLGDTTVEPDEGFTVTLSKPTNATIATATAVGIIQNDDAGVALPIITLAVNPSSVTEDGPQNLFYIFSRTGDKTNSLTVNFNVSGTATFNDDYTQRWFTSFGTNTGSVTFATGSSVVILPIDPSSDLVSDGNETVALTLAAGTGYEVGTSSAVTGIILDNDVAPGTLVKGSIAKKGTAYEISNYAFFAALKNDGSVVTWGNPSWTNSGGDSSSVRTQLASGVTQIFPTGSAFAALKSDGSVVTWGDSWGGDSSSVRTQLASGVTQIFSNGASFAALKGDGSVVTWGDSGYGGDSSGVINQLASGVTQIFSTQYAFAALKTDGSVVTWGDSGYGGDSSRVSSQLTSGITQIFSTEYAFAALKTDGSVVTWGDSGYGGGGYGGYGGDSSGVSNQLASGVTHIFSNRSAFAALKTDGSVVTWGDSRNGGDSSGVSSQLALGVTQIFSTFGAFAALKSDGSVVTWGGSGGDSSSVSSSLTGVTQIFSTVSAFAALKSDGSVVTWGDSGWGGDSSSVSSRLTSGVTQIFSTGSAFAALKSDGSVVTWGDSRYGGNSSSVSSRLTSGVTQIFSTEGGFAALKSDGSVVTWGDSFYGGDSSSVSSQLTSGVVSFADPFNDDRLVPLSTTPTTPTITLAVNPSSVTEDGTTNLVYTLTRTGDLANSLIVNVNGGGTAVLGTDFSISGPIGQSTSGSIASVTFAAGSSTATVIVDPIPNSIPGGNKTVFATLAPGVGYNIGTVGAVTGTILEDDVVAPTLAIASTGATQTEGNSGTKAFPFTVTRSGDTTSSSSANWAVTGFGTNQADVTDFGGTLPTGTVNFTAGETNKTIIVDVLGDTTVEPDEGFAVTLSNPTNATITTATAVGTIQNDDVVVAPGLAIAPTNAIQTEGNLGTKAFTFTVTRSGDTTGSSSANWAVTGSSTNQADVTDFGGTLPSGMVSFAAGETSQIITVNVSGDTTFEPDEGFTVTLSNPIGAVLGTSSVGTNIRESASGGYGVTEKFYNISSGDGIFKLNYNMYAIPDKAEILVNNVLQNQTNGFVSGGGSLDLNSVKLKAGDQVKVIITGNVQGTAWDYSVDYSGGISSLNYIASGVIINDDTQVTQVNLAVSPTTVTEDGNNNLIYTFTRTGSITNTLAVNYTIGGTATLDTDYTGIISAGTTKTVTFAAGSSTATVTIDPIADTTVEGDETVELTLAPGTGYNIDTTSVVTGTITNDDRTLTPIIDYTPNVNISTGLVFSTNGGGNLSLDTNRLSMSNEVTGVQNGTKSNFNHLFGLYEVLNAQGEINTEKGVLKPGDSDYAFYALTTARVKDFIVQAGNSDIPSTATQLGSGVSLQGNKFYAPFVIANCGTYFPNLQQGVEDFIAAENGDVNRFANAPKHVRDLVATEVDNEFNNAPRFVQEPVAYFSFGSANPDKSPHLRSYGNGVYGFEDLPATATQYSNNDFNDAVFALS